MHGRPSRTSLALEPYGSALMCTGPQSSEDLLKSHIEKYCSILNLVYSGNNSNGSIISKVSLNASKYIFRTYSFIIKCSTRSSDYFNLSRWRKICKLLRDAK